MRRAWLIAVRQGVRPRPESMSSATSWRGSSAQDTRAAPGTAQGASDLPCSKGGLGLYGKSTKGPSTTTSTTFRARGETSPFRCVGEDSRETRTSCGSVDRDLCPWLFGPSSTRRVDRTNHDRRRYPSPASDRVAGSDGPGGLSCRDRRHRVRIVPGSTATQDHCAPQLQDQGVGGGARSRSKLEWAHRGRRDAAGGLSDGPSLP